MDIRIIKNKQKFLNDKLKGYSLKGNNKKFDSKGKAISFSGCTIICKIPKDSKLSKKITNIQSLLKKFNPKRKYTYLPPSSFHMTVFDCCNSSTKNTKYWPKGINKSKNYEIISKELNKRIKNFNFPKKFNLKPKMLFGGYSIILEPSSTKDKKIFKNCRDNLSKLLKIKFENHKRYIFHITLAYILEKLNCSEIRNICEYDKKLLNKFKKEYPKITLNNPEMTTFKNMYKFKSINLSSQ